MSMRSFYLRYSVLGLALASSTIQAQQTPAIEAPASVPSRAALDAHCVLAGRLDSAGRWAPQAKGMQLLDAGGQPISGTSSPDISTVKAVRFTAPALLASCNAGQAIAEGGIASGRKSASPAVKAANTPLSVQAMSTLPSRVGGQWVELRVDVPPERVVMLSR